jgi:hypothetical protein
MKLNDFKKRKGEIWDKVEADVDLDFPLTKAYKDYVEREEVGNPEEYIGGDPEGEEKYLESLRSVATRCVTALKLLKVSVKGEVPSKKPSMLQKRGPFERRFPLVSFVVDCWAQYGRSYIPWDYVITEWNKANPYSPIVSKDTIERAYRRGTKEDGIMIQLLVIKAAEANTPVNDVANTLQRGQERQVFKELANADKSQDGESVLSLLYKHYVLTSKQEVSNRRRDILLSLAKRYRKLGEAEKLARQEEKSQAVLNTDQMQK